MRQKASKEKDKPYLLHIVPIVPSSTIWHLKPRLIFDKPLCIYPFLSIPLPVAERDQLLSTDS